MTKEQLESLRNRLQNDEAGCWKTIQELRGRVEYDDFRIIKPALYASRREALFQAHRAFEQIIDELNACGYDFDSFDPGHGVGHLARDFVNSARFLHDENIDPTSLYIGALAGLTHDLACGLIYRYDDPNRAVRHAEAGALLFLEVTKELADTLPGREAIAYAIAAHTHYLKETEVKCSDGVTRTIRPYKDTYEDGRPVLSIWLPRWIDRLDLCGPTIIGRHFLTLGRDHHDYSSQFGFTPAKFDSSMRSLLRNPEEIKADPNGPTMYEHIRMLVSSQNNSSPYGKMDDKFMQTVRDKSVSLVQPILSVIENEGLSRSTLDHDEIESIFRSWENFLGEVIEPSKLGMQNAADLCNRLRELDEDTQEMSALVFEACMRQYQEWERWTQAFSGYDYESALQIFWQPTV